MPLFTEAEIRALELMALPHKIAADRLDVHVSTIKLHHRNIARKLGAANRLSACVIDAQQGFPIEAMKSTPQS